MSAPASEHSAVGADCGAASAPNPPAPGGVRSATHEDIPAVVEAVQELLRELGGTPPSTPAMQAAAQTLLDSPHAGALLVMESDGLADPEDHRAIVGVLGVSWQTAIHIPGRYALIQDLWVHPLWRGRAIGRALLAALFERARELHIARVEVGLPPERFAGLAATEAFYLGNGFAPLGARMRRGLP
jgi:GNAT superfamily N-acetyltransferase